MKSPHPPPKEPLNFPQGGSEAVSNLCSLVLGEPHRNSPERALMSPGASHFLPGALKALRALHPLALLEQQVLTGKLRPRKRSGLLKLG